MAKVEIEEMERIYMGGGAHFIIKVGKKQYFQSFHTLIAVVNDGRITLNRYWWNCTKTTAAYRNRFLGLTTKQTKELIADGTIKLRSLDSRILCKLNPNYC